MTVDEAIEYVREAPWPGHSGAHEEAALILALEIERLRSVYERNWT